MFVVQDDYVTVAQAAALIHISPSTLWRWLDRGDLPAYRFGRRRVLLKRDDLAALITPRQGEKGEAQVEKERQRLNHPLTQKQQQAALAALDAARHLKAEMLERRGGKLFADSTEIIRAMREERSSEL